MPGNGSERRLNKSKHQLCGFEEMMLLFDNCFDNLWNKNIVVRLTAFICFLFRGVNEEEVTLKTNKQVYSLLLRATANKSMTLLERIEVILNLLEQLSQNSEATSGGIQ